MAANLGDLVVGVGIDDKLSAGLEGAAGKVDAFASRAEAAGSKVMSAGDKMMGAGTKASLFVTAPVLAGVNKLTNDATSLGESVNAVQVTFGEAAPKILAFGETAAQSAGLSKASFNELVTPIGAALQNVGFGADEAADASINLAQRAADMASVFNVDVSEALGAIQAGLRGEADPLERFGVGLSAAAVEAHALQMGLADTTVDMHELAKAQSAAEGAQWKLTDAVKAHGEGSWEAEQARLAVTDAERKLEEVMAGSTAELTDQQKAQARLSLLMKQSERVAGDFANTSDSAANAQRIAAAEAENLSAQFGTKLLPVKERLIAAAMAVLGWFERLTPAQQNLALGAVGAAAAIGPLTTVVGGLTKTVGFGITAYGKLTGENARLVPALRSAASAVAAKTVAVAKWAATTAASAAKAGAEMAVTAAKFVAQYALMAARALASAAQVALSWIIAMGPIALAIGAVVGLVVVVVRNWDKIKSATSGAWNAISGAITGAVSWFVGVVSGKLSEVVGFFTNLPSRILSQLGRIGSLLVNTGESLIDGMVRGIGNAASAVKDKIMSIARDAWNAVKGFFGISSPSKLMASAGRDIGRGLVVGMDAMRDPVTAAALGLSNAAVIDPAGAVTRAIDVGAPTGQAGAAGAGAGLVVNGDVSIGSRDDLNALDLWARSQRAGV